MEEEETKPIEEDKTPSFLEQVKEEREALEKVRDELKELKATEILSGKVEVKEEEEPKEETAQDYAKKVMLGEI